MTTRELLEKRVRDMLKTSVADVESYIDEADDGQLIDTVWNDGYEDGFDAAVKGKVSA